jgi:hypothetical protein
MIGASPFERLVEQQIFGSRTSARDRQHLLLAAGEIGAAAHAPRLQPRKHGVHSLQRPALGRRQPGEFTDLKAVAQLAQFQPITPARIPA